MEVHHHSHKPKNWKEYITEFIMLFAAVTLGFLAENLREHQIMNHRVEQNKIAILKDLQTDSADIAAVMSHVQSTVEKVHGIRLYSEVCLVGFPADLMTRFSHPSHTSEPHVAAKKNLQSLLGERA
jgi:hypothetical protein